MGKYTWDSYSLRCQTAARKNKAQLPVWMVEGKATELQKNANRLMSHVSSYTDLKNAACGCTHVRISDQGKIRDNNHFRKRLGLAGLGALKAGRGAELQPLW